MTPNDNSNQETSYATTTDETTPNINATLGGLRGRAGHTGPISDAIAATSPSEATVSDELRQQAWDLEYRVDTSARYHEKRRDRFEAWERCHAVLTLFFASAIVTSTLGSLDESDAWIRTIIAMALALQQVFVLVMKPSDAARFHVRQYQRYSEVALKMASVTGHHSSRQLANWRAEMIAIERDERPLRNAVWAQCHNEHLFRSGSLDEPFSLTWWQRLTAHLIAHDATRLEQARRKASAARALLDEAKRVTQAPSVGQPRLSTAA